jgi:hypothetical protein
MKTILNRADLLNLKERLPVPFTFQNELWAKLNQIIS